MSPFTACILWIIFCGLVILIYGVITIWLQCRDERELKRTRGREIR